MNITPKGKCTGLIEQSSLEHLSASGIYCRTIMLSHSACQALCRRNCRHPAGTASDGRRRRRTRSEMLERSANRETLKSKRLNRGISCG